MHPEISPDLNTGLFSKQANNRHVMNGMACQKNRFTIDTGLH